MSALSRILPHFVAVAIAGVGCVGVAIWAKDKLESQALTDLDLVMTQSGHDWADILVDGLSVTLTGTAPDEATRFAALSTAGTVVDASRIIDKMDVEAVAALKVPDFSIEVLKNTDGISLIGLVPTSSNPSGIVERVIAIAGDAPVADLLENADFDPPAGWDDALTFGLEVLDALPRSKVSITPRRVSIKAAAKDADDRVKMERRLARLAPSNVRLDLNITAPRPVVAPFTLRFVIDEAGPHFDACAVDSDDALRAVLNAARDAGMTDEADCILALGTPSTRWGEAAAAGIKALGTMGGGTLTLSNADIALVAREGTSETLFERAAGDLEAALPEVFSLSTTLPKPPEAEATGESAPPEFSAVRSPEGQVQLRGRLSDEATRAAVESFAAAQFGADKIYPAVRIDPSMPAGWPTRVLAALEALQYVHNGIASVTMDTIEISGATGVKSAQSDMARILSSKLDGARYSLDIKYSEALDPLASIPTPEKCINMITEAAGKQKITFAPSSTDIESNAIKTIDAIAEIVRQCQHVEIEIGGHTDSQGREVMNEQLSQARADAVLNAIMARRVLVSNLSAKGYGEAQPIADNGSEAGREANRRIEFKLVGAPQSAETTQVPTEEDQ
ncbi:MAG: OmpA family protein [Silicimonas sp.]|nr:OmpA family protein [Silicimonas sp.]